jgi:hypothetical protein
MPALRFTDVMDGPKLQLPLAARGVSISFIINPECVTRRGERFAARLERSDLGLQNATCFFNSRAMPGRAARSARHFCNRAARLSSWSGRVKELQEAAVAKAMVTKQWVLDRMKEVVERAMTAVPVLDGAGNPTGEYTFQGNVANRALELIGKELGMFTGRREDEVSVLHMTTDRPPEETREQWLARISRERGLPAPTIVDAATRHARNDS